MVIVHIPSDLSVNGDDVKRDKEDTENSEKKPLLQGNNEGCSPVSSQVVFIVLLELNICTAMVNRQIRDLV